MTETENLDGIEHHVQGELCTSRPTYRQGKKLTAVKVYSVNKESQHLMVYNVPVIGLQDELYCLCQRFGEVINLSPATNTHLKTDEFTEVFHVQYGQIKFARFAKKELDNREFFGGILHVCYAPELESVVETRVKLASRRKDIIYRITLNSTNKKVHHEMDVPKCSNAEFRKMFSLQAKRPKIFPEPSQISTKVLKSSHPETASTSSFISQGPIDSLQIPLLPGNILPDYEYLGGPKSASGFCGTPVKERKEANSGNTLSVKRFVLKPMPKILFHKPTTSL